MRWNSQRSGTPEAGPGGVTPREMELLGGGSPREVELPGGRRVELPGGGTRRREIRVAGHSNDLKTQPSLTQLEAHKGPHSAHENCDRYGLIMPPWGAHERAVRLALGARSDVK